MLNVKSAYNIVATLVAIATVSMLPVIIILIPVAMLYGVLRVLNVKNAYTIVITLVVMVTAFMIAGANWAKTYVP